MEDLSFGEQVKIILSRKGMTIKELAEQIEAATQKKMSRQNLTQRLGRDNFQEKDMRMIAAILGCPFQLSIFPLENDAGEKAEPMEELLLKYVKHPKAQPKKKKADMDDGYYQQVLVFDQDTPEKAASDADGAEAAADTGSEKVSASGGAVAMADTGREEVSGTGGMESMTDTGSGETASAPAGNHSSQAGDADFDGDDDLLEIEILDPEDSEDLDEADLLYGGFKTKRIDRAAILAAAQKAEEEKWNAITGTAGRDGEDQESRTQAEAAEAKNDVKEERVPDAGQQEEALESTGKVEGNGNPDAAGTAVQKESSGAEERDLTIGELYRIHKELDELEETLHPRDDVPARIPAQEALPVPEPVSAAGREPEKEEPEPEDFEPVIRYEDAEENLELGEMNPYTGREYQTNSVRMHPSRIGYVQVYDRFQHGWTDMTEWAFLGYQERKKTLLGRDYEPPIYLD